MEKPETSLKSQPAQSGCGSGVLADPPAPQEHAEAPATVETAPPGAGDQVTGEARQSRRKQRAKSGDPLSSLQSLAVTLVVALFVITFIVQAFQIPSESMENTLLVGDYLLVDKVQFAPAGIWGGILPYQPIRRGDIIVFHYPVQPQQHFVKRVIGLPGDRVRLKDKQVFINGRPLEENYAVHRSPVYDRFRDDFPQADALNSNVDARWGLQLRTLVHQHQLVVPPGEYFVLGDNRDESLDSRYWGFVPRENIVGRPLLIYWSMRSPRRFDAIGNSTGDRLFSFTYSLTHLLQQARWNRILRLIR